MRKKVDFGGGPMLLMCSMVNLSRADEGHTQILKRTKRSGIIARFVLLDVPSPIAFPLKS